MFEKNAAGAAAGVAAFRQVDFCRSVFRIEEGKHPLGFGESRVGDAGIFQPLADNTAAEGQWLRCQIPHGQVVLNAVIDRRLHPFLLGGEDTGGPQDGIRIGIADCFADRGNNLVAQLVAGGIVIEAQEMYGEFFDIPVPDELVFISSFTGGEVFRSGCTFRRGHGKIFFFSPGDQDFPVYHHPDVRRVIANGVQWTRSDRPERAMPTLLRYETDDFFNGHGYTGAIEDEEAASVS